MGKKQKNILQTIQKLPDRETIAPSSSLPGFHIIFGDYEEDPDYPISAEIQDDLGELFHLTEETDNPRIFIERSLIAIEKYPHLPQLRNALYSAYEYVGLQREYRKTLKETYQQFPNYFMATVDYARLSIEENRPQRVREIFHHQYEINLVFPDRQRFHVTEVLSFYEVMTLYCLKIGNINGARAAHQVLEDLAPDNPEVRKLALKIATAAMGL